MKILGSNANELDFFVDRVQDEFVNVQAEHPLDETKLDIIAMIKAELKITEAKQVKEQAEVET